MKRVHEEKPLKLLSTKGKKFPNLKIYGVLGGPLFKNLQPTAEANVDQKFNADPLAMVPSLCSCQPVFSTYQFNAGLVSLYIFANILWF